MDAQHDLFGGAEPPLKPYRADPDKVRARLTRILEEARNAEAPPWNAAMASLYRTIVPNMANRLPEDEAARWRADFEAEMARLEQAA